MVKIKPESFRGRAAVSLDNGRVRVVVLPGGGHIAAATAHPNPLNPLWEPQWPALEPNLRVLADPDVYGDKPEGVMLSSIAGHNLCCDVFGTHSEGERAAGLTFHGEAGMVQWSVAQAECDAKAATLVMEADLTHTALTIRRAFRLERDAQTVRVDETLTNKVGFQRALGVAQHVTLGGAFLGGPQRPALFASNADRGLTWPQDFSDLPHSFAMDKAFDFPLIPSRDGSTQDWRRYPRHESNQDLCSLRVRHTDDVGWFSAAQPEHGLAIAYAWQRAHYPWLMTWEENHCWDEKPWNKRELTRGLEFSSYTFALSRKENVELSERLETPCFTWLDAYEARTSTFALTVVEHDRERTEAPTVAVDDDWMITVSEG